MAMLPKSQPQPPGCLFKFLALLVTTGACNPAKRGMTKFKKNDLQSKLSYSFIILLKLVNYFWVEGHWMLKFL